MKSFAVLAGLSAVAAAQNATLAPALGSVTVSTATYTSCTTMAPGGTVTGLITITEPCTHYQCTASKTAAVMPAFTTSYSTVYTMYCPTATSSGFLQAYTTTVYETCTGASASFSAGSPGYVPSGWTTGVVTCTECGATPVSSMMTFPTNAPSGAVVPTNMAASATPAAAAPGAPAASPAASAGTAAPAPSAGASTCPGGASCPASAPGAAAPGAAAPGAAAPGAVAPAAGSVCPGGVKCPAVSAAAPYGYGNGTAAAVPMGTATAASTGGMAMPTGTAGATFMGAAGRSAAVGPTFGAAVVLAAAGMLL